jgi:hypothetical protein
MSSFIPNNEHFLKRARNIRNELLIRTDKYMLQDYPNLTPEQLTEIKNYRQALRDFININKDKYLNGQAQIDFPPQPDFINLNIIY